jgi:hypothetical protein
MPHSISERMSRYRTPPSKVQERLARHSQKIGSSLAIYELLRWYAHWELHKKFPLVRFEPAKQVRSI